MSGSSRRIIHLDMDAFYASVEQLDHPELRNRPVIVGGSRDRGVVSACSYEARAYGVRSAMGMARAISLCPQAVVLPVRMARYREISTAVFAIFGRYTDQIEPLSIDEAFLDVTGCDRLFGPAVEIAEKIRRAVRQELQLTVSAGIATNKFLAKLASEAAKPDGLFELTEENVDGFLLPLPVERLWGVGKITSGQLRKQGLRTVADLRRAGRERLIRLFGSAGEHLWQLSWGEDQRTVISPEGPKSVGCEETFARDLYALPELELELLALCERTARRLRREGMVGHCLTVKVRFADFSTVTRSQTFGEGTNHAPELFEKGKTLLGRTEAGSRPVRLLGVALSSLETGDKGQTDLFAQGKQKQQALDRALDRVFERYGAAGISWGSLLPPKGEKDSD